MLTGVLLPHKLVSYQKKINTYIYADAADACSEVANEIATLIKEKQAKGEYAVLGRATGATPKKVYAALIRMQK